MTLQETQTRRKKGRPRLSDALIQFRLPERDAHFLTLISLYEERDKAELLRALFLSLKKLYRKDARFRKWMAAHAEDLKAEKGIDVGEFT